MTVLRLAMWSGPRNVSTAFMRAWENRPDTYVVDEPFYGHYLVETGVDHPGADEVIAATITDWRRVVERIVGDAPDGSPIFYQKQMAHHLLPSIGREWLGELTHAFLIREPRDMLLSLGEKLDRFDLADTGLPQQLEIFESVRRTTGETPPVIDARDLRNQPEAVLRSLCDELGIEFTDQMLTWPAGKRRTDGVWAPYWYENVERSTGFQPYVEREGELPEHLAAIEERCRPYYETLARHRIEA